MTEKHKRRPDGQLQDAVSSYPITAEDRALYRQAQEALSRLQAPVLYHKNHPHESLYIAHADGTTQNTNNDSHGALYERLPETLLLASVPRRMSIHTFPFRMSCRHVYI